jgi:hypothetical protein
VPVIVTKVAAPAVSAAETLKSLDLLYFTKDEDPAVIITGTVNNLDLSDASTAVIALLQPVAVPTSY